MAELPMTLLAFRVTNFRSVRDSGWIETGDVTALIGTNESGKTNLLAPLWKLNPAKEGSIKLITDAPRVDFNTYRVMKKKPVFISGRFRLSEQLVKQVSRKVGASIEELREVEVSRDFDGNLAVNFPKAKQAVRIALDEIEKLVNKARADIEAMTEVDETDAGTKASVMAALETASEAWAEVTDTLGVSELTALKKHFDDVTPEKPSATSTIVPRFKQVGAALEKHIKQLGKPTPNDSAEAKQIITENLPVFVYYSTYGNLDSEINLPRAIEDLQRTDLTGRPEARARTLRVLFDFVNLSPQEILELGLEAPVAAGKKPTDEQNAAFAEKTKERSVLLQSASTLLTRSFREWWKQGEYIIRFEADGNHFRIWVSDDKRHEQIELENRSTGLQWFLSFYLIFLVESKAAHSGAILLLDEPGLSLHPLSQRDLTNFFDNLAITNPILYTTHSPFLVDADHLDRVRAVYVDDDGHTQVSTNLRAGQTAAQANSIYPVHAALGLSVSDTMFLGCRAIVVEGQSDQLYLSGIKNFLIGNGKIQPKREILFVPTTGAKAIEVVAAILGGRDEDLPVVLCDGDDAGLTLAKHLREEMYKQHPKRIALFSDFLKMQGAEVEDLFPREFMSSLLDRLLKGPGDSPFVAVDGPIVPQVKEYAKRHGLTLDPGWKVELATMVKGRLPTAMTTDAWKPYQEVWQKMFEYVDGGYAQTT